MKPIKNGEFVKKWVPYRFKYVSWAWFFFGGISELWKVGGCPRVTKIEKRIEGSLQVVFKAQQYIIFKFAYFVSTFHDVVYSYITWYVIGACFTLSLHSTLLSYVNTRSIYVNLLSTLIEYWSQIQKHVCHECVRGGRFSCHSAWHEHRTAIPFSDPCQTCHGNT